MKLSRRLFLQLGAASTGSLMLGVHVRATTGTSTLTDPWLYVEIPERGPIIIGARAAEIGQGVKTSLPMLIAEELDIAWSQVNVVQLPYVALRDKEDDTKHVSKFGRQSAGGSMSIPGGYMELRTVGATARAMLINAAAERWGVDAGELTTEAGVVIHGDKRLTYGELAADASNQLLPTSAPALKDAADFNIIGQPIGTADGKDIVTGRGYYGIDASLPRTLIAVIARCPYFEGSLKSVDSRKARKIPGVRQVIELPAPDISEGFLGNMAAGVAVLADDTWSAMRGRDALKIKWNRGKWGKDSTEKLKERALQALKETGDVLREDGDVAVAEDSAEQKVSAQYVMPFLAHSTLEPQNALVHIRHNHVTVIAPVQVPSRVSTTVSTMTGIDRENIDIEMPRSGGGFGRRLEADFIAEAVFLAQQVEQPVKLIWTREDDMQNDFYRPFGVHELNASVTADNAISSWTHHVASTGKKYLQPNFAKAPDSMAVAEADQFPAGCVANYRNSFSPLEFGLLCGWWRAPAPTFLAFPVQSFVDEVAHATGKDPLALRLDMLGEPRDLSYSDHGGPTFNTGRLANVTRKVAELIDYDKKRPKGRGVGIASHFVFGGYAAHAMEVSIKDGMPVIHRCVCVVDVGKVVNPSGLENQMIGGTIDGISTAMRLGIDVEDGEIQQTNFPNYPLLRMSEAPDVEVHLIESEVAPAGGGEMGIPTAAPALCNAIFAASGKRIRELPIGRQLRA